MSQNPSNTITVGVVEFADFCRSGGTSDAWMLYTFFRLLCDDGTPDWSFGAEPDILASLAEDELFAGWGEERYQDSIDNLESIGLIGRNDPEPSSWVLH